MLRVDVGVCSLFFVYATAVGGARGSAETLITRHRNNDLHDAYRTGGGAML